MKSRIHSRTVVALMVACIIPPLRAQLVNDGATNTLSNVTNSFPGNVIIGTNGSFTLLILSDNALLTNSVNGVIGLNLNAKSNAVQLISPTARWRMGGFLFVGSNGASSRLIVSDGAFVDNNNASLARSAASSNNFALITGSGSVWSNRNQLDIGGAGPDNRMIVSNGGWVVSTTGILGRDTSSSNNLVLVTGSGSVWSNALNLTVGNLLPGNRLMIEAGGLVSCENSLFAGSIFAGNNEALVTGPGSLFINRSFLTFGNSAGFNRLVVSNGAVVRSLVSLLGNSSTAVSNQVVVTGAGSTWTNQATLSLGRTSTGNRVEVSDGGWLACNDGEIGDDLSGNNNTVILTGTNSGWNNLANLIVGRDGSGNALIASNGAVVHVGGDAMIGLNSPASSNAASVIGPGTSWTVVSNVYVGSNALGNRFTVANGGRVTSRDVFMGFTASSGSNVVVVTGSGSMWSNAPSETFFVGFSGSDNRLVISNGGTTHSSIGAVGNNSGSSRNEAVVTGAGSVWNAFSFAVGFSGASNRFVISDGGSVSNTTVDIGVSTGGRNNDLLVTGPGSSWKFDLLTMGFNGADNRLVITNGGEVRSAAFGNLIGVNGVLIGEQSSAINNRVVVDGGTLRATNAARTALLEIRRGTNVLNAGLVEVDQLLVTNTAGRFELNGGTLSIRNIAINNGQPFRVGNGLNPATLNLTGSGPHPFPDGLIVFSNGVLSATGTLSGTLTVQSGGTLAPGASIGDIILSVPPTLQGNVAMEISKSGSVLMRDSVRSTPGTLTYGGALIVTKLGPTPLAAGDSFQLFLSTLKAGAFSNITLPPLAPGLAWTNRLLENGVIAVVTLPAVPPTVQTLPATAVGATNATLNGLANPMGSETSAWFQWGTTTNYGNVTSAQALGSGSSNTNFSDVLTGLTANVVHHFRAVASNSASVVFGADRIFFIAPPAPPELITYLKASNTGSNDFFGTSVAMSGDTIVVAARFESSGTTGVNGNQNDNSALNAGAAYVFVRNGTNWIQQAYLKASNTDSNDSFGVSVSISGETIVVGALGESSSATGVNGNQNNNTATNSGAAYVFVREGTSWTQQAYFKASNTGMNDNFGTSVAVSGDTVLVGASAETSNATGVNGNQGDNSASGSGAAYVFVRSGTNWTQQAYLKASNTESADRFGVRVAVSGDTALVGADLEGSNATGVNGDQTNNLAPVSGAAYVFVRNGTNWTQQAYLKASNTDAMGGFADQFGIALAISGDTVAVGAPGEDSNATGVNGEQTNNAAGGSGAAYVFVRNGTNWTQQAYLKASNTDSADLFGISVALSGDKVVVGASGEDSSARGMSGNDTDNTATNSGAAYVFVRDGTNWTQQAYLKASNTDPFDTLGVPGQSVAVSGDTVVVGARQEDSNATGVNGDPSDNSAPDSGAAYIFSLPLPPAPVLTIVGSGANEITLSWTPSIPGLGLQETLSLSSLGWSNSPSGETNPVTVPATEPTKFYRLFKP